MKYGIQWAIAAILVLGTTVLGQFSPIVDAERLGGVEGFVAYGAAGSHAGRWVAPAGDVNADGIADMAVGAFKSSYTTPGGVAIHGGAGYIVFGRLDGEFPADLSAMRPDRGFAVHSTHPSRRYVARAIGAAGDFNGDGIDDFLVTAGDPSYDTEHPDSLIAVVVFGRAGLWPALIDLHQLPPHEGVRFETGNRRSWSETAVAAAAGDINGDGVGDIIIGSPHAHGGVGRAHVVFGNSNALPASVELQALNGTDGFAMVGVRSVATYEGNAGTSVGAAGDMNGDGIDDVAVGSPGEPVGTQFIGYGAAHVVFGRHEGGFPPIIHLDELEGSDGFEFKSVTRNPGPRGMGTSVAGVGDINRDGIADLAVSAATAVRGFPPTVYILFGRRQFPATFGHEHLTADTAAIIEAPHTAERQGSFGYSLSAAGDVNGDGVPDILIGSPPRSSLGLPRAYVVFGGDLPARLLVDDLDGDNGFVMLSHLQTDLGGYSVAGVSDINGDGMDDVVMGARLACPADGHVGAAHVLFGGDYCRQDIDASGVVDLLDVIRFQNDYERRVLYYPDWNRDGLKLPDDLQAYLTDFAAGCP